MRVVNFSVVVLVATVLFSCSGNGVTNKSLNTELDSVSYAAGLDMGAGISGQLKQGFAEADIDLFVQGFLNGVDSTNLKMSSVEAKELVSTYFREKQQRDAAKSAEENFGEVKKEGEAFIAANKAKEGVISTASGLQYIVMTEGSGDKPSAESRVKVHYHGTLTDGTVFDSSVDRGEPTEFGVGQVIKGWTEGLQLMSIGSKFKFFIPQELAYGANPRPGVIKPFMPLVFEVELLEIK